MARASSPALTAPNSTHIASTLLCWCSATRCIATPSNVLWWNSSESPAQKHPARDSNTRVQWPGQASKEINDEPHRKEVVKPFADEGTHQGSAPTDARTTRRGARPQLYRSESRL